MTAPERGDLVQVDWLDIQEDPVGNPDQATLGRRTSYGLFWEEKQDQGVTVVVTTTTLDEHGHSQSGYCIYPASLVKMTVVKKGRKKGARKRRQPSGVKSGVVQKEVSLVSQEEV